jgi:hypothetical protein
MPSPLTGDYAPRVDPQFNLGGGTLQLLAQAIAQGGINKMMGGQGMVPGQFNPSQSFYDRLQGQQHQREMGIAMAEGSKEDRKRSMDLARGVFLTTGAGWGKEQQAAAAKFADQMAAMGPAMAQMFPQTWDAIHSRAGSSAAMAQGTFQAARGMVNPYTGELGLSGRQAGIFSRGLSRELFGDKADPAAMSGLGGAQAGQMLDQMSRHGMVGGLTGNTQYDTKRIAGKMKEMSGAVRAMQDIFGQDAPMSEIFKGLDRLTQGGLASMSPGQVRDTVRRMHALSAKTGMSMEAIADMGERGGQMAQAIGLNRAFGVQSAQSSTAFGQAFASLAGTQGFGGLSRKEATDLDQRLRTAAAGSAQGNALGAIANMAEQGLLKGIDTSTDAGRAKLQGLLKQTAGMNREQMSQFVQQQFGVSGATVGTFMANRGANQGAAFRAGVADIVREGQAGEVNKMMTSGLSAGFGGGERGQAIGAAMTEIINSMDPEMLNNPKNFAKRNQMIKEALAARGMRASDEEIAQAFASLEHRIQSNPALRQFGGLGGLVAMNRRDVVRQGAKNLEQADKAGRAASATAHLGGADPLRRITDALRNAKEGDDLWKIAGEALGGVSKEEVEKALGPDADKILKGLVGGEKKPGGDTKAPGGGAAAPGGGGGGGAAPTGATQTIRITGTLNTRTGEVSGTGTPGTAAEAL